MGTHGDWNERNPALGPDDVAEHLVLHRLSDVAQTLGNRAVEATSNTFSRLTAAGGALLNLVQRRT